MNENFRINSNWIDQIIGHKLLNSRDAYSRPSHNQLKESYIKTYPNIRIFKSPELEVRISDLEIQLEEKDVLIKGLLNNGVSKNDELEALRVKVSEIEQSKVGLEKVLKRVLELEKKLQQRTN